MRILQRPFLVNELDVNSRNTVSASAERANHSKNSQSSLHARQSNKAAFGQSYRREYRGPFATDVFRYSRFACFDLTLLVERLQEQIYRYNVSCVHSLISSSHDVHFFNSYHSLQ